MLSQGGSAVMLVSNKWMKSRYGEGLRRFFALRPPRMGRGPRQRAADNRLSDAALRALVL